MQNVRAYTFLIFVVLHQRLYNIAAILDFIFV